MAVTDSAVKCFPRRLTREGPLQTALSVSEAGAASEPSGAECLVAAGELGAGGSGQSSVGSRGPQSLSSGQSTRHEEVRLQQTRDPSQAGAPEGGLPTVL